MWDQEEEMVSLVSPETLALLAHRDHLAHQALAGTLLLRWRQALMRNLEVLRWV